ncbi:hypothetical protein EON65_30895 [archaeon]|nr:MAG: hypothetical protein EON65_30895 [archaeon]
MELLELTNHIPPLHCMSMNLLNCDASSLKAYLLCLLDFMSSCNSITLLAFMCTSYTIQELLTSWLFSLEHRISSMEQITFSLIRSSPTDVLNLSESSALLLLNCFPNLQHLCLSVIHVDLGDGKQLLSVIQSLPCLVRLEIRGAYDLDYTLLLFILMSANRVWRSLLLFVRHIDPSAVMELIKEYIENRRLRVMGVEVVGIGKLLKLGNGRFVVGP